jgi:hypothetical protein
MDIGSHPHYERNVSMLKLYLTAAASIGCLLIVITFIVLVLTGFIRFF